MSKIAMNNTKLAIRCALSLVAALACAGAAAQAASVPSSAAASAAAERAQKESDRTMYWIRVLSDKPAAKPVAAAPAPRPVAAAPVAKPVAEPRERVVETREQPRDRVKVAALPVAATGPSAAPARAAPDASSALPVPARDTTAAPISAPAPTALSSGSAEAAATSVGAAAAMAAPTLAPPPVDVAPPEPEPEEEPDPGLVMTRSVDPEFPGYAVRRLRKGSVEVKFEVDPAGVVVDASVMKTTNTSLNAAAVDAVKQWRFKPAPRSHTALVDLAFDLDK